MSDMSMRQRLLEDVIDRNPRYINIAPEYSPDTQLLIIVLCEAKDFVSRREISSSWAKRTLGNAVESGIASVIYVISKGFINNTEAEEETVNHDNILQINLPERYDNLVFKVVAALKWALTNVRFKTVLKVDVDTVVDIDRFLANYPVNAIDGAQIHCKQHKFVRPSRNSEHKWYISEFEYPNYFLPRYCNGPAYAITKDAVELILEGARESRVFQVEDAFITGVAAERKNITRVDFSEVFHEYCAPEVYCDVHDQRVTSILPTHFPLSCPFKRQPYLALAHLHTARCRNTPIRYFEEATWSRNDTIISMKKSRAYLQNWV